MYSKDEMRVLRGTERYTAEMVNRIVKTVMLIARAVFENHPSMKVLPAFEELPNTFIFRVALCAYLLALDWGALGGPAGARPKTLRNDLIDMSFAAYATFFDGLLSDDAKLNRIHAQARVLLFALFECPIATR
jgi:hypothetical protein